MKAFQYRDSKLNQIEKIDINDLGFLRGYGVFDFIRTYNRKPFLMEEHLKRLMRSASIINLDVEISLSELAKIVKSLSQEGSGEKTIRIILTGGQSKNALNKDNLACNTYLIVENLAPVDSRIYSEGVKLITCEYKRELPGAKTLNYINLIKHEYKLGREGAFTLLYVNCNKVLEAAISNIFIVKGSRIITPFDGILLGTTRKLVIDIASGKFTVEERDIELPELLEAEEVFITGTTQGIVPVVKVDSYSINSGQVGNITRSLIDDFNKYTIQ